MCYHNTDKCGAQNIAGGSATSKLMTTAYIRDQYKGEVCNYRVKVGCGAPVFLPYEGGTWSSKLSAWNITYVEWEEDQVH